MDKKLPNDPLEEFFKKSLEGNNELPSDDGWDVPSDNVWDNIEADIQSDTIVRPINYWKWMTVAASVIILFFGYQWLGQRHEINQLNVKLEEEKQKAEETKEILKNQNEEQIVTSENEKNHTINNHQNADASISVTQNEEVVSKNKIENSTEATSFLGKNRNGTGGKNKDDVPNIPNSKTENLVITPSNEPVFENKNEVVKNNQDPIFPKTNSDNSTNDFLENGKITAAEKTMVSVEILPERIFEITNYKKEQQEKINPTTNLTVNFSPWEKEPRFYVGAFGSRNFGTRQIVGRRNASASNDRKNTLRNSRKKEFWTYGGGAKVGLQINEKWSVETGVQYTKMEAGTSHSILRKYTTAGETMVDGEFQNDYALLIVTSFGDIGSDITMSRNTPIADQTPFLVTIDSRQNVSFLGVPIFAKYKFGKNKFRIGLKAGAMATFVLDSDIEIEAVTSQSPILIKRRHQVRDKREIKNLKSATFDFTAGIETEFQLTTSMFLSLEPSFSKSLTPIFEKDNVKTYPMMTNLKVGMNYYF